MTDEQFWLQIGELAVTAVVTVASAFFGAWYAFKLEANKAASENNARNLQAATRAIFELARTFNKFTAIRKQFIEEHRNNPARHLMIRPSVGLSFEPPIFNYDALSFLFGSSNPNLLGTLSLLEQEVFATLETMKQRSALHLDHVQPTIELLSRTSGGDVTVGQIEDAIGPRLAVTIRQSTDYLVEGVDAVLAGAREHIQEIKSATEKMYPGHKVVGMVVPSEKTNVATAEGAEGG